MRAQRLTALLAIAGGLTLAGVLMAQGSPPGPHLAPKPYVDTKNKFSIWPPAAWYVAPRDSRWAVEFYSTDYTTYIIIDVTPYKGSVEIDDAFSEYIRNQMNKVQEAYPGIQLGDRDVVKLNGRKALRQVAVFKAGKNRVILNLHYIPVPGRLYCITTAVPDTTANSWEPVLQSSLQTFTILE